MDLRAEHHSVHLMVAFGLVAFNFRWPIRITLVLRALADACLVFAFIWLFETYTISTIVGGGAAGEHSGDFR